MKITCAIITTATIAVAVVGSPVVARQSERVTIAVDAQKPIGPMTPMWAWFGYDEPNYTYMKDGQKLLTELSKLSPVPVYVRVHNLLTTGDGTPGLKWGSTNAYTEDANGKPIYDWTIVDRIVDTYLQRKMKPLMQIGFMPEALSVKPQPYKHDWQPGVPYSRIYTGWAHPPKDYDKWRELVFQWVKHSVEKYGRAEVESWWWEVWNEPDIAYWQGTPEEYMKMYDYAADGLKRALPTARIGGPHVTGPLGERTQKFLRDFIEHCLRGTNYATGKIGTPLDYVGFHAKGAPRVMKEAPEPYVRMGISNQLRAIANGFSIVASFPELKKTPIVIGESDPEGCAACPMKTDPHNAYRNGTMYSSYTAAQLARTYELADLHGVNLMGAVTWAFEFEDQPFFAGFRVMASNGITLPVFNVFRMMSKMGAERVPAVSDGAVDLDAIMKEGVRGTPDVGALASRDAKKVTVLAWHYHDDDVAGPDANVTLSLDGLALKNGKAKLTHYRIDKAHSNAYTVWQEQGSPAKPSPAQYKALEAASELTALKGSPATLDVKDGRATLPITLPRQAVSLVVLEW
jgi:xylan 1,4-beta-xylosidase